MSIPLSRFPGLLLAAASISIGCSRGDAAATQSSGTGGAGQQAAVPVAVAIVEQRAVPLELRAIGSAQAFSFVSVHSQITGELTSVNFKEGEDVRKGQVLFTLDRRPLEAALQTAEGNLERDIAQSANAATSAKRFQDLLSRGIATRQQVDESATTAAALAATIQADQGAVANARVQLQYATIVAPIQGRTGQLRVHPGNLVRANDTTPLVTINQVSPIYVAFGLPEGRLDELRRYLAKGTLHVEAMASGASDPGSPGRITFIDNEVDPMTGMITVKVAFENRDHRLWPGRFVNVLVTLASDPNAIVVPNVAVQSGQLGDYVYVVKPDRTVEYRKVKSERTVDSSTVISEGLAPGETVVTDGQLRLAAGTHIIIKDGAAAGVAP
jgi:multidrug efflux system membrane fusion protein